AISTVIIFFILQISLHNLFRYNFILGNLCKIKNTENVKFMSNHQRKKDPEPGCFQVRGLSFPFSFMRDE
ncbi:MAG: hypothetical protein K6E80_00200, partial [Schwartzia sp.]|nr:hypothetical protein [Schwartzia sp. (in: firmicutes)]